MAKRDVLQISVSDEMGARLRMLSKRSGIPVSVFVREWIQSGLDLGPHEPWIHEALRRSNLPTEEDASGQGLGGASSSGRYVPARCSRILDPSSADTTDDVRAGRGRESETRDGEKKG